MQPQWQQQQHPHHNPPPYQYPQQHNPQQQYPQQQYPQQQLHSAQQQYPQQQLQPAQHQYPQVAYQHRQPVQGGYFSLRQCRAIKGISICQIVMGCVSLIVGAYASAEAAKGGFIFNGYIGTGIWAGIFIVVTGIIGLNAAVKNTLCTISACMAMNIICSLFAFVLVAMSGLSLSFTSEQGCYWRRSRYRNSYYGSSTTNYMSSVDCTSGALAADSVTLIVGLAQFVITIVCSAICCGVTCCRDCCATGSSQPVVTYPMNQQVIAQPVLPQEGRRRYEAPIRPSDSGHVHLTPAAGVVNPPTLPAPRQPNFPPSAPRPDNEYSYVEPPEQQPLKVTSANVQQYFGEANDSAYVGDASMAYESIKN